MKLHIQPNDGIAPLLKAIKSAKKSIQILIFRFDRVEIEKALVEAARRGVSVTALIAFTNRGEERNLRKLEMRFLAQGIVVARTADDLVRYHGKMMIIDKTVLYVLGFNFTHLDINLSRSFSIVTRKKALVEEAMKLFECDVKRQPYAAACGEFIVSPINSRKELLAFIKGAKKQLLMYELKVSDPEFLKALDARRAAGVDVRIIGKTGRKGNMLDCRPLSTMRLHVRCMIRDESTAFLGSQSLRKLEMDARREIGIIFEDAAAIKTILKTFEKDWADSIPVRRDPVATGIDLPAKRVARAVIKNVPVQAVVEQALEKAIESQPDGEIEPSDVAETVHDAVKEAVRIAVVEAIRDIAANPTEEAPAASVSQNGNGKRLKAS